MKKFIRHTGLGALFLALAVSCSNPVELIPPVIPVDPVDPETIDAPAGLTVGTVTDTTAELSWTAVEGAEKYNLVIDDGASIELTEPAYTLEELDDATEYTWKVQAVKGNIFSEWAEGDNFTTELTPPDPEPFTPVPTELGTNLVTHNGATLVWQHEDADFHELAFESETPVIVNSKSYRVYELTPESSYRWELRSSKDGVWSEWVEGPEFTTDVDDGLTRFIHANLYGYYGDRSQVDTENFSIEFQEFDPSTENYNGINLRMDFFFGLDLPIDLSPSKQWIDLPEGLFPLVDFVHPGTISGKYSTIYYYKNGEMDRWYVVTDGSVTVDKGDHDDCNILFNVRLQNNGPLIEGRYSGPLRIENPYRSTEPIDLGTMTGISQFDCMPGIRNTWLVMAYQSPGIYEENDHLKGNGWLLRLEAFTPPESSTQIMPDHTYTIDRTTNEWTVFGGRIVNPNGLSVLRIENGLTVETRWLVSGTVKSKYSNGSYTIEVDAKDQAGSAVKVSVSGAGATGAHLNALPGLWGFVPAVALPSN